MHAYQGRSHVSKIGSVYVSFLSLQTSNIYSSQTRRGRGMGEAVLLPSRFGSLGVRRKLPQRVCMGQGRSLSRKRFWAFHVQFYAIPHIF